MQNAVRVREGVKIRDRARVRLKFHCTISDSAIFCTLPYQLIQTHNSHTFN